MSYISVNNTYAYFSTRRTVVIGASCGEGRHCITKVTGTAGLVTRPPRNPEHRADEKSVSAFLRWRTGGAKCVSWIKQPPLLIASGGKGIALGEIVSEQAIDVAGLMGHDPTAKTTTINWEARVPLLALDHVTWLEIEVGDVPPLSVATIRISGITVD
jgi:hypothetical protein